ncbi:Rha family transcriptional regulator [Arsenophonus sp. PmNCSU2021_1]|uniref:Rha family transcriptional regulator n=1 Tax=Arsenophonus sp. PmNCSU2021_1 TaxID=3118989 RepID=UPI002FF1FDC4
MKLVEIRKFDLVTNSLAIAQGVRRDHDTIIKLIDRNREDLEEFGRVGFEIRPFQTNGGMQKQRVALLNEQQTTLLITYMRNNCEVRAFKKILVKEFFRMRVIELERKRKHRESARLGYPHMMESVKISRILQGKKIGPKNFSMEADMINLIAIGVSSAEFKQRYALEPHAAIRDYLTPEQIRCVDELQKTNDALLNAGWEIERRKEVLVETFNRKYRFSLKNESQKIARSAVSPCLAMA